MKLGKMQVCYIAPVNKRQPQARLTPRFIKTASALIALSLFNINKIYAADPSLEVFNKNIDSAGETMFGVAAKLGYWGAILMCVWEIVKCIKDGDTNAVWGVITKYLIAFASLYIVRWAFDLVVGMFAIG